MVSHMPVLLPFLPCMPLFKVQYVDGAAAAEQQAAAEEALPEDPAERRQQLKLADAARRQAEEDLDYEEVPQADEDADGI